LDYAELLNFIRFLIKSNKKNERKLIITGKSSRDNDTTHIFQNPKPR